jgi:phosphoribosylaminoimidazole-succinocarboxamide synthase
MIEGKTKVLTPLWIGAEVGSFMAKNDITAGDGAKHDVMPGKAELATRTTCNVFEYLRSKGTPVAYIGRDGPTTFITRICNMVPVEVVVRRIAFGSYCKRHPDIVAGTVFEDPVIEFFYKTTGRRNGDQELPCDDPLMKWNDSDGGWDFYLPNKLASEGYIARAQFMSLYEGVGTLNRLLEECAIVAVGVNMHLKNAWQMLGGTLYDFKLEFGVLPDGSVVLADVVDCDSWRVKWNDIQLSKQGYRDGDDLSRVLGVYRLAASLTDLLV